MWQICGKYEANIRQLWDKYVTNMTQIWGTLLQCSDIPTAREHWRELHVGDQKPQRTQPLLVTIQERQKRFDLILKHLEIRRLSDAIVQPQQLTIDLAFQTCCNNNNLESLHVWHVDKIVPTHVYLPAGTYRLTLTIYSSFQRRLTQPQTVNGRFLIRLKPPETNVVQRCSASTINTSHFSLSLLLSTFYGWMWVSHF